MAQQLELRPVGLYTDPNPHGAVPKGALRQADNVVLRRDGILQPRPGFKDRVSGGLNFVSEPKALVPFDGDLMVIGSSDDDSTQWVDSDNEINDGASALSWDTGRDHATAVEARGNLYLATQDVVRKLESSNDVAAASAGVIPPACISGIAQVTSGTPILIQQYGGRAYRAVIERTDGNGVVITSAPSPAAIYQNSTASTVDADPTVTYGDWVLAGDVIKLYRTPEVVGDASANGVPGEEYFLVAEQALVTGGVSGTVTFSDSLPDNETGEALYSNPSQEGILQSNDRPHVAKDVALFRGSVFFANTTGPHRVSVAVPDAADRSGSASGVGSRATTGDFSSGTNTILNVASTTGLKVGMLISSVHTAKNTRITSIVSTTVTMNQNATGTGTTAAVSFLDSIRLKVGALEDKYYPIHLGARSVMTDLARTTTIADPSAYLRALTAFRTLFVDGTNNEYDRHELTIEEIDRAGNSFEMWATHGDEYEPVLPEPTVGSGTASSSDTRPNGIQWSKTDQPEHVPEGNFETVGGETEILRIVPTRDALFIFKKDGIWRLTGFGASSGWRIDPVDRSTFLLNPRSVTVMAGKIYAWTNRGVVRVNDYGVEDGDIISKLAIGKDLRDIEKDLSKYSSDTGGAWVAANEKDDELLVGVPDASGDSDSGAVYVYNTKTRSWVKWIMSWSHAVVRPDDGLVWVGDWDNSSIDAERRGDTVDLADEQYSVTINSVSSTEVTIAGGSGWTPAVGDMLVEGTDLARVTAITSATVFNVDMTGLGTGAATGYSAYESAVEFVAKTGGNPAARKHFQSSQVMWEDMINVRTFTMEFTSDIDATADSEDRTMTRSLTSTQPRSELFYVPNDHAMVSHLWPKVKVKQAGSAWEMSGLGIAFRMLKPLVQYSEGAANLAAGGGGGG